MLSQQLQEILNALQAGDKAQARRLLQPLLQENPSADAWFLAAQAVDDPSQMMQSLQRALAIDPNHVMANQALAQLQASGVLTVAETPSEAAPEPEEDPIADVEAASAVAVKRREADKNVYVDAVYEMQWDCKYCSTEKLLGKTHRFCPNCGSPQDPEWRYFPSDDEKVAVKDHKFVGADKHCPACDSLVAGNVEFCPRCGAPQTEAAAVKQQGARESVGSFAAQDLYQRQQQEFDATTGRVSSASAPQPKQGINIRTLAVVGVVIAALVGVVMFVTASREVTAYVVDYRWERSIEVEQVIRQSSSRECGSTLPAGAVVYDRRREQVDTRRVADGEECTNRQVDQGDGTFRSERVCQTRYRDEPVMGDVCYFYTWRWDVRDTEMAEGNKSQPVSWPPVRLQSPATCSACSNTPGQRCENCQREGDRRETYYLVLRAEDDTFECPVDLQVWEDTPIETTFTLNMGQFVGGADCNSLQRAG